MAEKYFLNNGYSYMQCDSYIKDMLSQGIYLNVNITRCRGTKSQKQLGYYYAVIILHYKMHFIDAGNEHRDCTEKRMDDMLKILAGFAETKYDYINDREYDDIKSKADMTVADMSLLIETSCNYAAQNDIFVPPAPSMDKDIQFTMNGGEIGNKKYLKYLRKYPCMFCTNQGNKAIHAHHIRIETDGGTAMKPSDCYCLPMCSDCHGKLHANGELSFYLNNKHFFMGLQPYHFAKLMYDRWINTYTKS